jgi:hypothetical protein
MPLAPQSLHAKLSPHAVFGTYWNPLGSHWNPIFDHRKAASNVFEDGYDFRPPLIARF